MARKTTDTAADETTDLPVETTDEKAVNRRATNVFGMAVAGTQDALDRLLWNHIGMIRSQGGLIATVHTMDEVDQGEANQVFGARLNELAADLGCEARVKGRSIVLEFDGPSIYRRVLKVIRANSAALDKASTSGSFGDMKLLSIPHAGIVLTEEVEVIAEA